MNFLRRWIFLVFAGSVTIVILIYFHISRLDSEPGTKMNEINSDSDKNIYLRNEEIERRADENILENKETIADPENNFNPINARKSTKSVNYNVHIFYYPWYGNPAFDNGTYHHWNHNVFPPWDARQKSYWVDIPPHRPPDAIGANFYPQLGCYSNRDPAVLRQHMEWIRDSGAGAESNDFFIFFGVVVVSWYPPGQSTEQGEPWDDLMPALLDAADQQNLKIAFHIEPYKNRNVENLRANLRYIFDRYSTHPAFYRHENRGKSLPLFYIYDSYQISGDDWRSLLRREGTNTVRNTPLDAYFIGLLVSDVHKMQLPGYGFDGYYTYFASNGFTFGSTWHNWRAVAHSARRTNMIFIPSVGPGYIDESIRPWNKINTKNRNNGEYYSQAWDAAISSRAPIVAVTSFNEWHEGTQIEPAVPKILPHRTYLNYEPFDPDYYLKLTRTWAEKLGSN